MIALRSALLLLPVLVSGSLIAQQTLIVGPGQPFADIQSAINASAPGDTIALRPLQFGVAHAWCTVGHSLSVRSDPPGGPRARWNGVIATLTAGSRLHVQDLDLGEGRITGGLVTFEGVNLSPTGVLAVMAPVLVVTQASVSFRGHFQQGTAQIDGSAVAAIDSRFISPTAFAVPGPALVLNQSSGFFSQCSFEFASPYAGTKGLVVNAGSRADLVGCQTLKYPFFSFPMPSTPSLVVDPGGVARQHRCTFDDGTGTATGIVGTVQPHTMLGASLAQTQLLVGGSMTVNFHAEPLDPVFVLATFQLDPPTLAPLVEPEQWGFAANGFLVTAVFANAAGIAPFSTTFANNPVLRGRGIWLMGASGLTFPLPLSVPVGGLLQ